MLPYFFAANRIYWTLIYAWLSQCTLGKHVGYLKRWNLALCNPLNCLHLRIYIIDSYNASFNDTNFI